MGNTNSAGQKADTSLLSGLRYKTEETVAKDLTSQLKIDNELKLSKLATMILNEAVAKEGEQWMSAKYAKLVKLLCTIRVVDPKSRQFISFKDVFTKLLTLKLDELKQDRSIFLPSNSMMHKYDMFITLLGELFNADVYSATMISFWLDVSLEKHEPLKQQLLLCIRFKVETEHKKVGHEELINSLMDMMVERGIVNEIDTSVIETFHYRTEESVANEIMFKLKIDNEVKLTKLATFIFDSAAGKESGYCMTVKFANLVKHLCAMQVFDTETRLCITFKGALTILVMAMLEEYSWGALLPKTIEYVFLPNTGYSLGEDHFVAFLGELFNADVYSGEFLMYCLTMLEQDYKKQLLEQTRTKIERELLKPNHEATIDMLREKMVENGIIKLAPPVAQLSRAEPVAHSSSQNTNASSHRVFDPPKQLATLLHKIPRRPVEYDSTTTTTDDDDNHNPSGYYRSEEHNFKTASFQSCFHGQGTFASLPNQFRDFLVKLETNPSHTFDLKCFQTCSESDRKQCARLVLEAVISHPVIIKQLSRVVTSIQVSNTPKNSSHLKFSEHLSAFCEAEINQSVRLEQNRWPKLKSIGTFLGQLYNLDSIKKLAMNNWFYGVQQFVEQKNVNGTNVYLEVLQETIGHMKTKDPSKFKFHVLQLQNLPQTGYLTIGVQQWRSNILKIHLPTVQPASTAPSVQHVQSAVVSNLQQQATGAIRTIPTVQLPPKKPTPSNKNQIMLVQQKLNKMYDKHDPHQILNEIVALKIESSESNLRKIANMIASKIMSRPDVIKSSIEILSLLPHRSNPPFAANELKKQLKLSLLDQYYYLQDSKVLAVQQLENLLSFTTRLISKKLVDDEIITEITENLALTARNGDKVPLEILIKFIGTYGCFLLAHPLMLKETATTLNKHSKSSSSEVKKGVEEAVKWITPKEVQAKPVQQAEQCQPSTSAAAARVDNKKVYCDFLLELRLKSIEDIKLLLSKIRSPDQCEEFAAAYYEAVMKTEQFMLFAKFAQLVEKEFEVAGFRSTFVDSLIQALYASYTPITQEQMKASKAVQSRVQFIGELYKIKWIDIDGLAIVMDMLSETELLVELFLTLLQIVSLAVVKNGDGEKLKKYRELYSNRQDGYEKSTSDFLTCTEVVEILEDVASLSGKRVVFDNNLAQAIIGSLNTENIDEQAEKIKSMTKGSANEFEIIVNAIVNQVGKFGDEKLMASFSQKLVRVFEGLESLLKEKLEEKCQDLLLEHVAQNANAKKLQNSILVEFYAELYLRNVLSSNFIVLCCDILCDGVDEHNDFSLHTMVSMVGAKLEDDDKDAAVKIFKKFNGAIAADETESYFVKSLQSLVDMRENGWTMTGNLQSLSIQQDQKANALLNKLTRANLTSISTCKEVTRLCESSPKELVVSIYYSVIQNANKAEVYADLCDIISRHSSAFQDQLKDFLRFCIGKVSALKKQDFQDDTRSDLAHLTVFIGELFVRDLIDEDLLTVLLKPAKNLRFDSINQLAAVIGHKVNESANIRLKAVLINLEDVAQEDTKQCWEDLKKDIGEITEIVSKNAEMETVVVAEPTTIFYTSSDVP